MRSQDSRAHLFPHTSLQGNPFQDPLKSLDPETQCSRSFSGLSLETLTWHSTASEGCWSVWNETDSMGVPLNRQRDLCLENSTLPHSLGSRIPPTQGSQEGRWERGQLSSLLTVSEQGGSQRHFPPKSRLEGKRLTNPEPVCLGSNPSPLWAADLCWCTFQGMHEDNNPLVLLLEAHARKNVQQSNFQQYGGANEPWAQSTIRSKTLGPDGPQTSQIWESRHYTDVHTYVYVYISYIHTHDICILQVHQGLGLYFLIIKHTNVFAMKYTICFKCDFFKRL